MKRFVTLLSGAILFAVSSAAQEIPYGDDSGQYAFDGECDDARFSGPLTVADLDWTSAGRDATDCKKAVKAGATLWYDPGNIVVAEDCDAMDFGDDSLGDDKADDGWCDDNRFYGLTSGITFAEDNGKDRTDCLAACRAGTLFIVPGDQGN